MLKTNQLLLEKCSALLSKFRGDCLVTEAGKTQKQKFSVLSKNC